MAAEYRIFKDTPIGTGAFVVKASNIDPAHGEISRDNPMIIELPVDYEPSLQWECLNAEAEEAMKALIAKKDDDEQTWTDGRGNVHTDTGTHQREKFARHLRFGPQRQQTIEEQGIKVKSKPKPAKKPVQAAMSESHDQVVPSIGKPKKAI
jgi:hypothetical protein